MIPSTKFVSLACKRKEILALSEPTRLTRLQCGDSSANRSVSDEWFSTVYMVYATKKYSVYWESRKAMDFDQVQGLLFPTNFFLKKIKTNGLRLILCGHVDTRITA